MAHPLRPVVHRVEVNASSNPGISGSFIPLCPLEVPQSHRVATATGRSPSVREHRGGEGGYGQKQQPTWWSQAAGFSLPRSGAKVSPFVLPDPSGGGFEPRRCCINAAAPRSLQARSPPRPQPHGTRRNDGHTPAPLSSHTGLRHRGFTRQRHRSGGLRVY